VNYNRLAQNKYVVGFLIVTSIMISGVGIFSYFTNEPPTEASLVSYTGRVENISITTQNDDPSLFTFNVTGATKKFFYRSFYPDFDTVLAAISATPQVTVWIENTASETPNVWMLDVSGRGHLVTYDQWSKHANPTPLSA
jgi:hypothetical protein